MTELEKAKLKIQKLLAMASEDSNASESEIQTAIAKARLLMVKYKLSELDLNANAEELKIVTKQLHDITYSMTKNYWIASLAKVICDNYCCRNLNYHSYGAKTRFVGIVGAESDIEIAEEVLRYAIDSILSENDEIRKSAIRRGYTNKDATCMGNAFGAGFVQGLKELLEEQTKEETETNESFALVMTASKEVDDFINNMTFKKMNSSYNKAERNARKYDNYAVHGYRAGKNFNMHNKLAMA